jgi:DNA-binding CsgD family transcriptional regulator
MLDVVGLDELSVALYSLLLRNPELGMEEIGRELGSPPEMISEALDVLKRLAVVRPSWRDPCRLWPVSPQVGLAALLTVQEADLLDRHRELNRSRAVVEGLIADYEQWRADQVNDVAEKLQTIDETCDRIEELIANAESEVVTFNAGVFLASNPELRRGIDETILGRGLTLRAVYLESVNLHQGTRGYLRQLVDRGAQLRTVPTLPNQLMIFDGKVAMMPLDPEADSCGSIVVRGAGPLTVLIDHFETTWAGASPLGSRVPQRDDRPTGAEQAALAMLAQGLTDEAVARKLDVSLRTVRRMMARLMKELGTTSRFEAGVRAAQRGWV